MMEDRDLLTQLMVPAQLMVPGFKPGAQFRAFLESAVLQQPLEKAGFCRTSHILAAYWRAHRL